MRKGRGAVAQSHHGYLHYLGASSELPLAAPRCSYSRKPRSKIHSGAHLRSAQAHGKSRKAQHPQNSHRQSARNMAQCMFALALAGIRELHRQPSLEEPSIYLGDPCSLLQRDSASDHSCPEGQKYLTRQKPQDIRRSCVSFAFLPARLRVPAVARSPPACSRGT